MDEKTISRRLVLLSIKYAPAVLTLACCVKILMLCINEGEATGYERTVNWINWMLNVLAVGFFYVCGKYFGYCWKHRSLCRTALWGHLFYADFVLFQPPHEAVMPIVVMYVILVCAYLILYKEL